MEGTTYEIKNIDHLGIVSSFCDEIDLVGQIDRAVASDKKRKVSVGQGIKALVLNGMGYTTRTLYLSHVFFKDKPVELLLGAGLRYEDLNDDCLASCLDAVYEYGVTKLFMEISFSALRQFDIDSLIKHLDSTTLSVSGERQEEAGVVNIVRGYNKQGQHDLNQVVLQIVTNNDGGLPLFMQVHDGNEVDKKGFKKVINEYKELLKEHKEATSNALDLWVMDNAIYTKENIKDLGSLLWLTRAGHNLLWVKTLYETGSKGVWQSVEGHEGYKYQVGKTNWGGVQQGALVIWTEKKERKDLAKLEKKIATKELSEQKALNQLQKQSYDKASAALKASKTFSDQSLYHSLDHVEILSKDHYKPGRRAANAQAINTTYSIQTQLVLDEKKVEKAKSKAGKFVLVSNEINKSNWSKAPSSALFKRPVAELLSLYKNDQQKPERFFRFLKDPLFSLSQIFLKLPRRIIALCMVMCLSLLIYTLAERQLRQSLRSTNDTLPNQLGKEVSNPTMRWIFQQFQGIHILYIRTGDQVQKIVTGLTALHQKILAMLGNTVLSMYQA